MHSVTHGKEVVLRVTNDIGILGEVCRLVSERGISVKAVAGSVEEGICTLRIVTDDNLRTCDILHEHAYKPVEESVVLMDVLHKPGMLKKLANRLGAEGVDIRRLYASVSDKDTDCLIVMHTTNDAKALIALSEFVPEYA
ncbi:hypothetical protein G0Q06_01790 [Puniceicoccales bacterium CK1056]|uniref:ACT domain-containing protein n=1 Tax=Oceanipulchritudo coccoides TaxID=2706888 RepID=A0A6B2LYQ0_9BACT|nr:hypothetical protein [Oceanipulchritudo coccoides]NDV61176.1 hypothetical protein [Oceanipulchritudo coccoides]